MAKIKVHEIAKELDKQSKEIIAFLQGKGIEVKAAQSSLEEDVADMVRKAMGGAKAVREAVTEKKEEAKPEVRAEGKMETKAQAKEMKAEEKPKAAENVPKESKEKPGKAPENRDAKSPEGGEKPKKKKKIIFVSNPHNSNMTQRPSQGEKRLSQGEKRPGQTGARPGQGNNNRQGSRANEGNNGGRNARNNRNAGANKQGTFRQEAQHKIIRPLTAPSVPESMQVDFKQNARRLENERLARNAQALKAQSTEEKAAENSGNVNAQASENNNQRTGSNGGGAAGGRGNAAQAFGSGTQTGYAAGQERGRQPAETALHPGLPRERKGVREMRELREMKEALEAVRAKGIREMTPADLTALIVRAVRLAGVISGVMALKGIITDLAVIITALREATRDRMVDLSGAKSRVRVSIRRPRLRTRSAGMTRSAGLARRKIKSPGKTSSTKRTMQR